MSDYITSIDPGSNNCGLAYFSPNGTLLWTKTLTTNKKSPFNRRLDIAYQLDAALERMTTVCEEPLLLGRNNNGMQRLLGMLEFLDPKIHFIHPMTVKKTMGSGTLDKLEVALAAGERLKTEEEKELMADIIAREAWDESDAVAIGLTYLEQNK